MSIYGCSHVCITLTIHHVNKFEMLGEMLRETEKYYGAAVKIALTRYLDSCDELLSIFFRKNLRPSN
jgi:hypothetical protein